MGGGGGGIYTPGRSSCSTGDVVFLGEVVVALVFRTLRRRITSLASHASQRLAPGCLAAVIENGNKAYSGAHLTEVKFLSSCLCDVGIN